jgi:hypothetical protein
MSVMAPSLRISRCSFLLCVHRGDEIHIATCAALTAGRNIKIAVEKEKSVEYKGEIDL